MTGSGPDDALHSRVAQGFRRSLASYEQSADVQSLMARQLVRRLRRAGAPPRLERVFEFGCGTGNLTRALTRHFTLQQFWVNDLVADTRSHLPGTGEAFLPGAIEELTLPDDLQLICSASTIQWIADIGSLLARLDGALQTGGWLALSGFGPAQFQELAALGSRAQAPCYLTAPALCEQLPRGFEPIEVRSLRQILWFDRPRDVLRHLRASGVNALSSQRWTRGDLAAFEADYVQSFAQRDRVPLTYEPVWLIAQKR